MTSPRALLGAVLAGGASRRFGSDKALAMLDGESLLTRAARLLDPHTRQVIVVGGAPRVAAHPAGESPIRLEIVPDLHPGLGPVGGLATALEAAWEARADGCLVLACDMPLVAPSLLAELVSGWDGQRVLVPASSGPLGVEPLCGLYPTSARARLTRAIEGRDRSMQGLLDTVPMAKLPLERVRLHGDPEELFLNVNREADLERARRLRTDSRPPR